MVKIESITIPVPRTRYGNIGVNLGVGDHSNRVRDIERLACLDFWHQSGAFKSIKIDNLVKKSTGTDQLLMLSTSDIDIDVNTDHSWKTGGLGGTQMGATVRHREIDYWISYSFTGQIIDMVGDVKKPKDMGKVPRGIVPGKTDW